MTTAILVNNIPYEDIEDAPSYLSVLPDVLPSNKKPINWCKRSSAPRNYASICIDTSTRPYRKFDETSFLIFYSCREGEGSAMVRLDANSLVTSISFSIADTSFYTDDQFIFEVPSHKVKKVYGYFNELTHTVDDFLDLEDGGTIIRDFAKDEFKDLVIEKLIEPVRKIANKELKHINIY